MSQFGRVTIKIYLTFSIFELICCGLGFSNFWAEPGPFTRLRIWWDVCDQTLSLPVDLLRPDQRWIESTPSSNGTPWLKVCQFQPRPWERQGSLPGDRRVTRPLTFQGELHEEKTDSSSKLKNFYCRTGLRSRADLRICSDPGSSSCQSVSAFCCGQHNPSAASPVQ